MSPFMNGLGPGNGQRAMRKVLVVHAGPIHAVAAAMKRDPARDRGRTLAPLRRLAVLIAICLIGPYGLPTAADDVEAQAARLRSLVPQVARPSPSAEQTRRGFLTYWAEPTSNAYFNIPPTAEDLQRQAVIHTFPGEDEPLLLGIWGLRDMNRAALWPLRPAFDMTVRAPEAAGEPLTLPFALGQLELPWWLAPDAPQPVRRERNVFFWINVHVPAGTEPGTYHGQLELTVSDDLSPYLSKPGGWANVTWEQAFGFHRVVLPVTVEVLPVALPPADIAYGMYFRGVSSRMLPPQYLTEAMVTGYYRDMARHGHTSAYLSVYDKLHHPDGRVALEGLPRPEPQFVPKEGDGRGAAYEGLPELRAATRLAMMQEAGLLRPDIPIVVDYAWGPTWYDDHAAISCFAVNLREEFRRRGWPEPLRYGPDEPDAFGPRAAMFRKVFEEFALTRSGLRQATAVAPEHLPGFVDDLDVWVVLNRAPDAVTSMNELFRKFQGMAAERGAEVWTYVCNAYGTNPAYHRYYAGLLTWAHRLRGNFLWCYAEQHTWEGDRTGTNYCYVLPSRDGPVPSLAWEARREGIEDYRILRRIERLCEDRPDAAGAAAAGSWLERLRQRVIGPRNEEGPAIPGFPLVHIENIAPQFGRGEVARIRDEALRLLVDLEAAR